MSFGSDISTCLNSLLCDARALWVPSKIPRAVFPPRSVDFLRNHVAPNVPVIYTDVCVPSWGDELSLEQIAGDLRVDVAWTPSGYGDHVERASGLFVKPHIEVQTLREFLSDLRGTRREDVVQPSGLLGSRRAPCSKIFGVPYYSAQNDCFRRHFSGLLHGLPSLEFAQEAFGAEADAINLWVGDERSITSMHKDHYENLFMVISGEKRFTLRPPCDVTLLSEQEFQSATYVPNQSGRLEPIVDTPTSTVPWIMKHTNVPRNCHDQINAHDPIEVVVKPGEMLYLPSLWYHEVRQVGFTVAVNWWFDMCFTSPNYVYYNFLRELVASRKTFPSEIEA